MQKIFFYKVKMLAFGLVLLAVFTPIFTSPLEAKSKDNLKLYLSYDCEFCSDVEDFLIAEELDDQVEVIRIEDEEGKDKLRQIWNRYDINPEDRAWPFLSIYEADTLDYVVGKEPIERYLSLVYLDQDPYALDQSNVSKAVGYYQELLIGFIAILIIGAIGTWVWYKRVSKFSNQKNGRG